MWREILLSPIYVEVLGHTACTTYFGLQSVSDTSVACVISNPSFFPGKTVDEAADLALGYMKSRLKGLGGLILVSRTGEWVAKWTSTSMPWAAVKGGKVHAGIDLNDTTVTDLC